jgi:hypothetical protein
MLFLILASFFLKDPVVNKSTSIPDHFGNTRDLVPRFIKIFMQDWIGHNHLHLRSLKSGAQQKSLEIPESNNHK